MKDKVIILALTTLVLCMGLCGYIVYTIQTNPGSLEKFGMINEVAVECNVWHGALNRRMDAHKNAIIQLQQSAEGFRVDLVGLAKSINETKDKYPVLEEILPDEQ